MQQEWARVTINLTPEEYGKLQLLASIHRASVSKFVRELIRAELENYEGMDDIIAQLRPKAAKSF
jgi:predicted DNA-binding protein